MTSHNSVILTFASCLFRVAQRRSFIFLHPWINCNLNKFTMTKFCYDKPKNSFLLFEYFQFVQRRNIDLSPGIQACLLCIRPIIIECKHEKEL